MAKFSDLEDVNSGPLVLESKLNNDQFLDPDQGFATDNADDEMPF